MPEKYFGTTIINSTLFQCRELSITRTNKENKKTHIEKEKETTKKEPKRQRASFVRTKIVTYS